MIIAVASGKGGTGKTTVAVSLALALRSISPEVAYLDCDVEEPNGHIFLKPKLVESEPVYISVPEVSLSACNYCGKCADICAYNALLVAGDTVMVFPELCHGCGGCSYFCEAGAVELKAKKIGIVELGNTGKIKFIRGCIEVGVSLSPLLIETVKEKVRGGTGITVIDAPPGTSCPAVHSVQGTDFCLLVTEPTPFGLNDLDLAVEMAKSIGVPYGVIINRARDGWGIIDKYCRQKNINVLLRIPLSLEIARAYSCGLLPSDPNGTWLKDFRGVYRQIRELCRP